MKISKRIQELTSLVPSATELLWDICCDHGLIGKQLITNYPVNFIDQVPSIMDKLNKNLKDSDIPKRYKVITSDARLFNYQNHKISTYILAGIGGSLSIEILDKIKMKKEDFCIISAHKNTDKVRKHLISAKYKLIDETLVEENSQFYEILLISKSHGEEISLVGSKMWTKADAQTTRNFLDHQLNFYSKKAKFDDFYKPILNLYRTFAK